MTYTFTVYLPTRAITFTATISQAAFILSLMAHVESRFLIDTSCGSLYFRDNDNEASIAQAIKNHFRARRDAYSVASLEG